MTAQTGEPARRVLDLNPGADSSLFYQVSFPNNPELFSSLLADLDGDLIFSADDGVHGTELWRTDGTAYGTTLVRDIREGPESSLFHSAYSAAAVLSDRFFFAADDGEHGLELWATDGTAEGTTLVKDIVPGEQDSNPNDFLVGGGLLYFLTYETYPGSPQTELWRSDGTATGTFRLMDGDPRGLHFVDGMLLFSAHDADHGREPWRSDGTVAGTRMLRDIFPGPMSSGGRGGTRIGDTILFSADDGVHGTELWSTDGTSEGTRLFKDVIRGSEGSAAVCCYPLGELGLLTVQTGLGSRSLWITDGTEQGTVSLIPSDPVLLTVTDVLASAAGRVWFSRSSPETGNELWVTDGTAAGTILVQDIYPGAASSAPRRMTEFDGKLYFSATEPTTGRELWRSDGTVAGTTLVEDFWPGHEDSRPYHLTPVGDRLYLSAYDRTYGRELWALGEACPAGDSILCLRGGRFRVEVKWRDFAGEIGSGHVVPFQSEDSGLFWFFSENNWELMVKVLDGCDFNDHYWVFAAGTTDVEVTLKVTDTASGSQVEYVNPLGRAAEAITDIIAFGACE